VSARDRCRAFRASREVRHTVIEVITAHLRAGAAVSWQGLDFDFNSVIFDGGGFDHAVFSGGEVNFVGAMFSGARVSFSDAEFSGGKVYFYNTEFSGSKVDFAPYPFCPHFRGQEVLWVGFLGPGEDTFLHCYVGDLYDGRRIRPEKLAAWQSRRVTGRSRQPLGHAPRRIVTTGSQERASSGTSLSPRQPDRAAIRGQCPSEIRALPHTTAMAKPAVGLPPEPKHSSWRVWTPVTLTLTIFGLRTLTLEVRRVRPSPTSTTPAWK
jgi:hypothetical protein